MPWKSFLFCEIVIVCALFVTSAQAQVDWSTVLDDNAKTSVTETPHPKDHASQPQSQRGDPAVGQRSSPPAGVGGDRAPRTARKERSRNVRRRRLDEVREFPLLPSATRQ